MQPNYQKPRHHYNDSENVGGVEVKTKIKIDESLLELGAATLHLEMFDKEVTWRQTNLTLIANDLAPPAEPAVDVNRLLEAFRVLGPVGSSQLAHSPIGRSNPDAIDASLGTQLLLGCPSLLLMAGNTQTPVS